MILNDKINRDADDSKYLASIEQYKNESWYDRLLENPWLGSKQMDFEPNLWQALGEAAGFYNERQSYYQDLSAKRNQWLADTLAQYHQQDYDAANSQVERERSAGLNPDLNGNITPGSAAENDEPIQESGMPSGDAGIPDLIGSISAIGEAFVNTTFSTITGIQAVKSNALDIADKSLKLNTGFAGAAHDILLQGFSEGLQGSAFDAGQMSKPQFVNHVWSYFNDRLDKLPYSKREKARIRPILESMIKSTGEAGQDVFTNDFESMLAQSFGNVSNSRADSATARGRLGANLDTEAAVQFFADKFYRPLNQMQLEVENLITKYNKSYYSTADGAIKAESDNAGYRLQKDLLGVKERITSFFKQIDRDIQNSGLGPRWKLAARAGLASSESLWFTQLNQGLHFSHSSMESGMDSFSRNGQSHSRTASHSWSF